MMIDNISLGSLLKNGSPHAAIEICDFGAADLIGPERWVSNGSVRCVVFTVHQKPTVACQPDDLNSFDLGVVIQVPGVF